MCNKLRLINQHESVYCVTGLAYIWSCYCEWDALRRQWTMNGWNGLRTGRPANGTNCEGDELRTRLGVIQHMYKINANVELFLKTNAIANTKKFRFEYLLYFLSNKYTFIVQEILIVFSNYFQEICLIFLWQKSSLSTKNKIE